MSKMKTQTALVGLLVIAAIAWFGGMLQSGNNDLPPWPLFRAGTFMKDVMESGLHAFTPDNVRVIELITAFWRSRTIALFAEFGIADVLRNQSLSCSDISASIERRLNQNVHDSYICRILDASTHLRLLKVHRGLYSLTGAGRLLDSSDGSLRAFAMMMHGPTQDAWAALSKSVLSGKGGWEEAFGENIWDYFSHNKDDSVVFDQAMTSITKALPVGSAVARDVPIWSQCRRICDVGGGRGHLLADILQAHTNPNITGVVLDRPGLMPQATEHLASRGLSARAEAHVVDFFKPIDEKCDCVVMKFILHDWSDEDSVRILQNVAATLPADGTGRVAIVENILDAPGEGGFFGCFKSLMDINMMASCPSGGRERTEADYRALLEAVGLKLETRFALRAQQDVLVAVPLSTPTPRMNR